jgi:hypothetical protein
MSKKDFDDDLDIDLDDDIDGKNDLGDMNDIGIDDGFEFGGDIGGSAPMDKHKDLLKELTDFSPFLKDLFNHWLGLQYDDKKKEFTKSEFLDPMLNIKGAMWCIGFLKVYARGNNIITVLRKDDYYSMILSVIDTIWYNLGSRMEEFGIKNNGDLITIATQLQHATELILMGAGDGQYSKLLKETVTRSENVSYSPQQMNNQQYNPYAPEQQRKNSGFLGRVKNAFGGGE